MGSNATELDFFGGGSAEGSLDPWGTGAMAPDSGYTPTQTTALRDDWLQNQGLNPDGTRNTTNLGTSAGNGGTATGWQVASDKGGTSGTQHSGVADTWATQLGDNDQVVEGAPIVARNAGQDTGATVAHIQQGEGLVDSLAPQYLGPDGDRFFDTSGADRGVGGAGYGATTERVQGISDNIRAMGERPPMGGMGNTEQVDALDRAMAFAGGPRATQGALDQANAFSPTATSKTLKNANAFAPQAQNDVMGDINSFLRAPETPSAAQLTLQEGAQGSMADALSMARSGRARDAGSQARMMNQALAENAATGVDTARNAGLLRAKETADAKAQQLNALGLKGNVAQGVDQTALGALDISGKLSQGIDANKLGALGLSGQLSQGLDQTTLGALGLGGDISSALRSANVAERGQSLGYTQGMTGIGAGLEGDILDTIPKMEQVRHQDQFALTPQQQLEVARMGQAKDKTAGDYIMGAIGDVLGIL